LSWLMLAAVIAEPAVQNAETKMFSAECCRWLLMMSPVFSPSWASLKSRIWLLNGRLGIALPC
jgi:hypothetical protein